MTTERYRIEACLGRGGFGEVFRAHGPDGVVALKVLRADLDPSSQAVARLRDEARWLSLLDHPGIPSVHALGRVEGRLALVTEYIAGEDLSRAMRSKDPPPPAALFSLIGQVADALDAAWTRPVRGHHGPLRLVHRDIKPSNLRIRKRGGIALLDLGIARTDELSRDARTQTSRLIGSPGYFAPERFHFVEPHAADDVFSLGAVLYEGLVGRRLLANLSLPAYAGLAAHPDRLDDVLAERIEAIPSDLPDPAVDLLTRMLRTEPADRPTAAEVRDACHALAPFLPGRDLAAWCADHRWSRAEVPDAPWIGRTIEVRILDRATGAILVDPPGWQVVAVVLGAALAGAFLVHLGLSAGSAAEDPSPIGASAPPPAPIEVPATLLSLDAPSPSPQPAAETPTAASPPRPVAPSPTPRAAPSPPPAARPASPEGIPKPPLAFVQLDPGSDVQDAVLTTPNGEIPLPARVAPGTYGVVVRRSGVPTHAGRVTLGAGPWSLRCAFGLCSARSIRDSPPVEDVP